MLFSNKSCTVGNIVYFPHQWCHICKENAFVGWVCGYFICQKSCSSIGSCFELQITQMLTFRCLISGWLTLFIDESSFCLQLLDGRVKVLRCCGEHYADGCTSRVTAFGGGCVMVWGNISLTGKTRLSTLQMISMQRDVKMRFCNQ